MHAGKLYNHFFRVLIFPLYKSMIRVKSTVLLLRITTTFSGPNDMFIAVLGPLMRPQLYKSPPSVCTVLQHQLNPFTSLLFYQWIFQVWRQFTWCFVTLQQYLRPVSEDTAKSDGGDCFKLGITGLETGKICLYNSSLILRPPLGTDTINGLFNPVYSVLGSVLFNHYVVVFGMLMLIGCRQVFWLIKFGLASFYCKLHNQRQK